MVLMTVVPVMWWNGPVGDNVLATTCVKGPENPWNFKGKTGTAVCSAGEKDGKSVGKPATTGVVTAWAVACEPSSPRATLMTVPVTDVTFIISCSMSRYVTPPEMPFVGSPIW